MTKNLTNSSYRVVLLLLSIAGFLALVSCSPVNNMIKQGDYDAAVDELANDLVDGYSSKMVMQLDQAYQLANSRDLNQIQNLKSSGQPNIWHEVFDAYSKLNSRQMKVAQLPPDVLSGINFVQIDYSEDVENARERAAAYYYALAQKHIDAGDFDVHPEAYDYLNSIHLIFPGYRDVEKLLEDFKIVKPVQVYYAIEDEYPGTLPPGVSSDLENVNLSVFDTPSYRYVSKRPPKSEFKVYAEIRIKKVKISPGKTGELYYTESVEIQDGVAYKLDESGNFLLDSLDQKIEIPSFETLACYVSEFKQTKSILLLGEVEIIERSTGRSLGLKSIKGETKFEHFYAKYKGDMDALSPESMVLVGTKKAEFPSDGMMIRQAGEKMAGDAAKKIAALLDNVELK